jgi:hypothetical protein
LRYGINSDQILGIVWNINKTNAKGGEGGFVHNKYIKDVQDAHALKSSHESPHDVDGIL